MKYASAGAFAGHLKEASPDHFSSVYLVICPDEDDRMKIMKGVVSLIAKQMAGATVQTFSADQHAPETLLGELGTLSLFGDQKVVLYDGIDKWKKEPLAALTPFVSKPSAETTLVLGAGSARTLNALCEAGKRELVVLDLSKEKPWDKKKRREGWLLRQAQRAQKQLTPSVLERLFAEVGDDIVLLENELAKVITYIGDRTEITLEDLRAVCATSAQEALWKTAESLVWEKSRRALGAVRDPSDLFVLIAQVRSQMRTGHLLQTTAQTGEDPTPHLPRVYPKALQKYRSLLPKHRPGAFAQGLMSLFETELKAKNSALDPRLLWDHLCFKWMAL